MKDEDKETELGQHITPRATLISTQYFSNWTWEGRLDKYDIDSLRDFLKIYLEASLYTLISTYLQSTLIIY